LAATGRRPGSPDSSTTNMRSGATGRRAGLPGLLRRHGPRQRPCRRLHRGRRQPRLQSRSPAPTGPLPPLPGPAARRRMRAAWLRSRSPLILPWHSRRRLDTAA
jgi:hypothetical protein